MKFQAQIIKTTKLGYKEVIDQTELFNTYDEAYEDAHNFLDYMEMKGVLGNSSYNIHVKEV